MRGIGYSYRKIAKETRMSENAVRLKLKMLKGDTMTIDEILNALLYHIEREQTQKIPYLPPPDLDGMAPLFKSP